MAARRSIPSNQTRGFRLVSTLPWTQDGQQFNVDLPRGPHIESVAVRVSGTVNVTVAGAAVRSGAAYKLIRSLSWLLNSNVTLDSLSGIQLAQLYITRRQSPVLTNPSGFAIAAYAVDATFIIDRCLMDMGRPKDSMLKTDVGVANNQLRLQMGNLTDMFTGAPTVTYTAMTVAVSVVDYQEAKNQAGQTPSPLYYIKRNGLTFQATGAGNGLQQKLNTGNRLRLVSGIVRDAATGEPNLALLTKVSLSRAGDSRVDITTPELVRLNQAAYGIALLPGQFVIDFANNGQLGCKYSEFWPIPSSADTNLKFDVTAACTIEMATIEGVDITG